LGRFEHSANLKRHLTPKGILRNAVSNSVQVFLAMVVAWSLGRNLSLLAKSAGLIRFAASALMLFMISGWLTVQFRSRVRLGVALLLLVASIAAWSFYRHYHE
jgi:hypothetical protein